MNSNLFKKIENVAQAIRSKLNLAENDKICLLNVLDKKLTLIDPNLKYEIVDNGEFSEGTEAEADTENKILRIPRKIYQLLQNGDPRSRFTIAHELGHFMLGHDGLRQRNSLNPYPTPKRRRQETEANTFAAELLVPIKAAMNKDSPRDIANSFSVSLQMAENRFLEAQRLRYKLAGKKRPLPSGVIDFLKEREKRTGYKFQALKDEK